MWLFPLWKLRKSKAVWYGRRASPVRDAAPWAVVCVDPIHCMVSGVFFFFEPDGGAPRWVPPFVCKWRDIGDPINGWKYMGNWGYFTRKWSYASSRGLLCWNGALSSWNSLLVDCKTVWGPSMIQWYQRSTLCCSLSMFSIVFVLYIYIRRQTYDIFIFIRLHKVCFHMIHTQRTQGPQQTASSDSVLIMIDAIPNGPWAKGLGFENPRIIP